MKRKSSNRTPLTIPEIYTILRAVKLANTCFEEEQKE